MEIRVRLPSDPPRDETRTVMPLDRLGEFLRLLPADCHVAADRETLTVFGPNREGRVAPVGRIDLRCHWLHWYGNHWSVKRLATERPDVQYDLAILEEEA